MILRIYGLFGLRNYLILGDAIYEWVIWFEESSHPRWCDPSWVDPIKFGGMTSLLISLFIWLVVDGWCWFVLKKSTADWLLVAGLFWEKSTAGWWLINQTNRASCWGVTRKIRMIPLTREREFLTRSNTKWERRETVIPSADCTSSKKSESVYTCPRAPFYREMKGLLHTKNTLNLRDIPSVNAYKNVFLV
jgi:hypothetical protein